jgi:hypothetical protein
MNVKLVICAFFGLLMTSGPASVAVAAHGPYFAHCGLAPWIHWPPSVYVIENVPYFAVRPPVYYSYPVARPYGYLPYPYLPGPLSREVTPKRPVVIDNPYVTERAGAMRDSSQKP